MKTCTIDGCDRRHAAFGYCLMHYKRVKKYGSPEYRWGGKVVGRACKFCERPVAARDLCMRHYQMLNRHGDPLYADKKRKGGTKPATQFRRGYIAVISGAEMTFPPPATSPKIEKSDRAHRAAFDSQGKRSGGPRRREWQHRKIAGAKRGQIVHHIDLNPINNEKNNLHVFNSATDHAKAHRSLEKVAAQLVNFGLVEFDRRTGSYRLAQSVCPTKP